MPMAMKIAVVALVRGRSTDRRAVGCMSGVAIASASSDASKPMYLKVRYSVKSSAA